MKLYKEPLVMTIATIIAALVLCYFIINPINTSATVDNKVPLPLQLSNSSVSASTAKRTRNAVKSIAKSTTASSSSSSVINPIESDASTSSSKSIFDNPLK